MMKKLSLSKLTPTGLFLFLAAIFYLHLKWFYPSEGIGWQDDLFISPGSVEHYLEPIINYYTKSCGRLGEMTTYTTWNQINLLLNKVFGLKALHYPWYSWRILDVLLASFALLNLLISAWKLSGMRNQALQLLSVLLAFIFFTLNVNQSSAVSLMIIFVNYCGPLFFATWVLRKYASEPAQKFSKPFLISGSWTCFYVAITHEQLLFTSWALIPMYVVYPYLTGQLQFAEIKPRIKWAASILIPAALIYFLSPGQRLRQANLSATPNFHFSLRNWASEATETLIRLLTVPEHLRKPFKYVFLAVFVGSAIYGVVRFVKDQFKLKTAEQRLLFFAILHLSTAYAIQVTLAVSGYFPDRARVLPMTQFCVGLMLLLAYLYVQATSYFQARAWSRNWIHGVASIFLAWTLIYTVPTNLKLSHNWWNGWDEIGGRAARFYSVLAKTAESSKEIIIYDYDACHQVATTYDVPHSTLWFLKWQGIEDKVEILTEGKVINPKPANLPRAKKPIPCG